MKLFISKLHYKTQRNLFENIILLLLKFVSMFYGICVFIRNKLYDFKILKSYTPKALTVSVGNLTTGGVRNTPVVSEIENYY